MFGLFIVVDVLLLNLGRSALRRHLQRMWAAGHNVRRVVVAGAGDLGEMVAETLLAHRELGYRVVGFLDDRVAGERAGVPVLGTLDQAMRRVRAAPGRSALRRAAPRGPRQAACG